MHEDCGLLKKWKVKEVNKHRSHITHYILLFTHRVIIHASVDSGAGGRGVSLQIITIINLKIRPSDRDKELKFGSSALM